jgi:hypothetical protein
MVGDTRGTPERFPADQASGSLQPPLPPPNLAEVMARQTELLNLLVQAQQNQQRQQSRGGRDDPHPRWQIIKTSSAPSLHYFIRRMSPLTLTLGFAPSNPSLPYCLPHVQMRTRPSLQPNNSVALPHLVGSLSCHATCRSCRHLG